jgi:hypothetical protein
MPSAYCKVFDVAPDDASLLALEIVAYGEGPLWSVPISGTKKHAPPGAPACHVIDSKFSKFDFRRKKP